MTVEQLRAACVTQPFHPFSMHLADGREIPVLSPEFIMSVPSGRTIIVCQPDDSFNIIDVLMITDLEFRSIAGGGKKRPKH